MSARRAVIRWALRLFRREWRQQSLVLAVLAVAVAVAIGGTSAIYGLTPVQYAAKYGTANMAFRFPGSDVDRLRTGLEGIRTWFGTVDVIGRRMVPVPGAADVVEFRAQDPRGAYGRPMLTLREGRYPAAPGELAVTEGVAKIFGAATGSRFALDGTQWTVVGLVENPSDLSDRFALVSPAHAAQPTVVTILARGTEEKRGTFPERMTGSSLETTDQEPSQEQLANALTALVAGFVAMLLVSLVAAAGFVVIGRRRQRQLGLLAAIGATEKHLRLVMLANGAVVGVVAALVGAAAGLLGWMAAAPYVEPVVGARIDRFEVLPWWLVAMAMLLAVLAATAAAWWPARALSRVPVTVALSGRPSPPAPVRRSLAVAGVLLAGGVLALASADMSAVGWTTPLLLGAGTVAIIVGILFFSPLAVRAVAARARRAPVAVRLALRDLARYQSRSSAVLAAISLTLGIAFTVIIAVSVVERGSQIGDLSERQMVLTVEGSRIRELVTLRTPAEVEVVRAKVSRITAPLDRPAVIALEMAADPKEPPNEGRAGNTWRHAVLVGDGPRTSRPGPLFVATPELLRHYGIDPAELDPGLDVLTVREGEVGLRHLINEELVANVRRLDIPAYVDAPTSLITLGGMERRGWAPEFAGYLVESRTPLTNAQIAHAHSISASTAMQVRIRDGANLAELRTVRTGAMVFGVLVALGVLAMTVGLIRGEAAGDLRTLAATGATGRVRRTITAATVGALAALGGVLGVAGAYLGIFAAFYGEPEVLWPVPVGHLLVVGVGVPLLAAAGGWLLSGRQPPSLVRRAFE